MWIAAGVFLVVLTLDWMVTIAQTIITGRTAERVLYALRIRVFSHLQRLSLDYYDRELGGRIMTRMTTDIEALTALLQNGLVAALGEPAHLPRRRHRARHHELAARADHDVDRAAAGDRHPLVPALVVAAPTRRRGNGSATVNADFQESLSGVRVSQAYVNESRNSRRFAGLSQQYLVARLRAQKPRGDVLPVRRDAVGDRRGDRAGSRCPLRGRRHAVDRRARRVPALPRPVLLTDPAAVTGVRHLSAGVGRARPRRRLVVDAHAHARGRRFPCSPVGCEGRSASRTSTSPTRPRSARRSVASTCRSRRARPWRSWARPAPASRPSRSSSPATTT